MYFDGVAEVSSRDRLPIFPQRRGDGPRIHDCQVRDGETLQFVACVPTSHPVDPLVARMGASRSTKLECEFSHNGSFLFLPRRGRSTPRRQFGGHHERSH